LVARVGREWEFVVRLIDEMKVLEFGSGVLE
jgi:hypothetical protein